MKIFRYKNIYYGKVKDKALPIGNFKIEHLTEKEWVEEMEKDVERDGFTMGMPEKLDPPVETRRIMALGLNYMDHAKETGQKIPEEPVWFEKSITSITGHGHPVIYPKIVKELDYEVELAVVIGKKGKYIEKENAYEYIAGYTIMNDVSARDHQFRYASQWFIGKSFDTFAPIGPVVVDRWEIGDPHNLNLETRINGELRQKSNTSNLIFKIDFLIEFISNVLTLEPGDIISTGTPGGVGFVRKPPLLLKVGDKMDLTVEKIGTLSNKVIEEKNL